MKKILVCEDEKNIVSFLVPELGRAGYQADVAYDGEQALTLFSQHAYDLILLDLMLPGRSGLEVLQTIRQTSQVPVIILTARKDTFDKVLLLKSGADDYITKPFETLELLARIERNINRNIMQNHKDNTIQINELFVDYEGFSAHLAGAELSLTKTEFEVLFYLCQHANKVLSREQIAQKLYGDFLGDSNVVDVNIKNIRRKLAVLTDVVYIHTIRGKGYVVRT